MVKIKDVPRYKTAKCREYEKDGYCSLDVHCKFAHGSSELRKYGSDIDHFVAKLMMHNPGVEYSYTKTYKDSCGVAAQASAEPSSSPENSFEGLRGGHRGGRGRPQRGGARGGAAQRLSPRSELLF